MDDLNNQIQFLADPHDDVDAGIATDLKSSVQMASIESCFECHTGHSSAFGNFTKEFDSTVERAYP